MTYQDSIFRCSRLPATSMAQYGPAYAKCGPVQILAPTGINTGVFHTWAIGPVPPPGWFLTWILLRFSPTDTDKEKRNRYLIMSTGVFSNL